MLSLVSQTLQKIQIKLQNFIKKKLFFCLQLDNRPHVGIKELFLGSISLEQFAK